MVTVWAVYNGAWYHELLLEGWIHFENYVNEHNLAMMVWRSNDPST
jgi:hypothetical protein